MLNIVFMGTPDFAKESLESIYNAGHNIMAVVTNPDRPKGRGMKMIASPVKEFAIEKNIPVLQPNKIREIEDELIKLKPDLFCVVAYGKILPQDILDIPKLGSINVHGSLLPKYRGAAPIQWAVINGDKTTGITTMYMDAGMDTGDMILKKEVEIGEDETTGELWNRLSTIGANLLVETVEQIEKGIAPRIPQGEKFTMAPMLNKEMSKIDLDYVREKLIKLIHKKLKNDKKHSSYQLKQKIILDMVNLGYDRDMIMEILSSVSITDQDKLEREYEKLYEKLKRKYDGKELFRKIQEKLYSKGFDIHDIQNLIDKKKSENF